LTSFINFQTATYSFILAVALIGLAVFIVMVESKGSKQAAHFLGVQAGLRRFSDEIHRELDKSTDMKERQNLQDILYRINNRISWAEEEFNKLRQD
jgi:hypothetical protein